MAEVKNFPNIVEERGFPEKKETCVVCRKLTGVSVDTPVDLRRNYLPGFGQVCAKCIRMFD